MRTDIVRDPNNLRNRYRRMRRAWHFYGWVSAPALRDWARYARPDSYAAPPRQEKFGELLLRALKRKAEPRASLVFGQCEHCYGINRHERNCPTGKGRSNDSHLD